MKPARAPSLQRFLPQASARLRLTVVFALVVTAVGAAIVTSIVLVMTFVPAYRFTGPLKGPAGGGDVSGPGGIPAVDGGARRPQIHADTGDSSPPGDFGLVTVTSPRDILELLLVTSLIVFAVVLTAGIVVCWHVAGRILRPIDRITEAASQAAAGSLDHRIALAGPDDEFRRLASTFDDMLERLERSFQAQRRFAANASHELRTPLATTQAILDVALLDPAAVDTDELVPRLRETNTRSIETIEALLALSDAQSGAISRDRIELDELAREVVASHREAAVERGIVVHTTILAGDVVGDPTLVRLLVGNLVGNAIRYNHGGGDVWLTVADGRIRIENTGPVVTPADLPRLTEAFYRSAGRVAGSHGLGLALVDAIATSHGASLALSAREAGGLVVTVTFPR